MELLDQMGFQQLIQNLPFANLTDLLAILSLRQGAPGLRAMPEYCSQTQEFRFTQQANCRPLNTWHCFNDNCLQLEEMAIKLLHNFSP